MSDEISRAVSTTPWVARKPAPPVFSVDLRPRRCGLVDLLDPHRRGTLRIVTTRQARRRRLKDPRPTRDIGSPPTCPRYYRQQPLRCRWERSAVQQLPETGRGRAWHI